MVPDVVTAAAGAGAAPPAALSALRPALARFAAAVVAAAAPGAGPPPTPPAVAPAVAMRRVQSSPGVRRGSLRRVGGARRRYGGAGAGQRDGQGQGQDGSVTCRIRQSNFNLHVDRTDYAMYV